MAIVKASEFQRQFQSAIVMDMGDLERQAKQMLAQAKAQADQILTRVREQAEREVEVLRKEAAAKGYEEGYAKGVPEGLEAGRKEGYEEVLAKHAGVVETLTKRWSEYLDLLMENIPTHLADIKQDVIRLAISIAERTTKLAGQLNPHVTEANVAEAMSLVSAGRAVALHVPPGEIDHMEEFLPDLLAKLRSVSEVELVEDETIEPGGCTLQFGAGAIDATLETQIQRITEELLAQDSSQMDEGQTNTDEQGQILPPEEN